ncbi:MAG: hypothetical protein Alis3KO_30230 [Aliiglaciecola sp.]
MSKDFRHQKDDWESDDWSPQKQASHTHKNRKDVEVNRMKKDSKRMSRSREKHEHYD